LTDQRSRSSSFKREWKIEDGVEPNEAAGGVSAPSSIFNPLYSPPKFFVLFVVQMFCAFFAFWRPKEERIKPKYTQTRPA
jgi:hypothetical protein